MEPCVRFQISSYISLLRGFLRRALKCRNIKVNKEEEILELVRQNINGAETWQKEAVEGWGTQGKDVE